MLFEKYFHLICINIIFLLEFEILVMKVEWQSTRDTLLVMEVKSKML